MRYLHPVQVHEKFVGCGEYRFVKDGRTLDKTEAWAIHEHADGGRFIRVDVDARRLEGRLILAEALLGPDGALTRLDVRYENARSTGGIKHLRASYQLAGLTLQVGYNMNGAERQYSEVTLPPNVLLDIPLLIFRGEVIHALAGQGATARPIYVPMFEHAPLFPGSLSKVAAAVDFAGDDTLMQGKRPIPVKRYTYRDRAAVYWIDRHGIVVKRVNAYKQQEIVVKVSNYAMAPRPDDVELR